MYLFIYKFDNSPQLNSSINQIDGWSLFCPSNLTNDDIYKCFINNQLTKDHQSFMFAFRELNSTEMDQFCLNQSFNNNDNPPITDKKFNFTSNYQLRVYTSGFESLTNYNETECYSTHLTIFAVGFNILPEPINWNYIFSNVDFNKNKRIYLTILYLLLIIYLCYKDKITIEKLELPSLPGINMKDQYHFNKIKLQTFFDDCF